MPTPALDGAPARPNRALISEQGSQRLPASPAGELPSDAEQQKTLDALANNLNQFASPGFPVRWQKYPSSVQGWLLKVLGIVVTGLSAATGASTWFAMLGNTLALRSSLATKKAAA